MKNEHFFHCDTTERRSDKTLNKRNWEKAENLYPYYWNKCINLKSYH